MRSWAIRPVALRSPAVVATAIALGGGTTLLLEGTGTAAAAARRRRTVSPLDLRAPR